MRDQAVFGGDQVRAVADIDPVGVGPMLVRAAPRIGPVVVDLAAKEMPAQAPHVLVRADLLQMLVAEEDVVDIKHFEGEMVEAGLLVLQAEEGMVVDILVAAVEPVERTDDVVLAPGIDVVGTDEAEGVAELTYRIRESLRCRRGV